MPQPRVPTNVLKLRGGLKNRPSRAKLRENEPENVNPVGKAPNHLSKTEKLAFNEIVKLAINGVLGEADRLSIELAACLLVKCRDRSASSTEQHQFFRYLSVFGMTPADRSKIRINKPKEHNPFDE